MTDSRMAIGKSLPRGAGQRRSLVLVVLLVLAAGAAEARAEDDEDRPSSSRLVLAGVGMALPTYALGVTIHEGTHAIVARAFGRTLTRVQLLPGFHPQTGRFQFGYVQYRGHLPRGQRTFFLLAPKLVDAVMLGGYATLVATDTLPRNHYGQLALAVLATGFWVDFSKDIVAFWRPHDINMALDRNGFEGFWDKLPWYLLHASLAVAGSFAIVEGYQQVFADDDRGAGATTLAPILPVLVGRF